MPGYSKTLLIDGSNAVHALFEPLGGRQEIGGHEETLVRMLARWVEREPWVEAEIVFDGGWRPVIGPGTPVRVLFSEGQSADSVLLERVRALRYARKKVSVVTLDRALAQTLRKEEAKVVHPERLWDWISNEPER